MNEKLKLVFDSIYTPLYDFDVCAYITKEPLFYKNRTEGTKKALNIGERWGDLWDCAWMNFKAPLPDDTEDLTFLLDVGGEGCVFDADGTPYRGITNKDSFYSFELGLPGKVTVPFWDGAVKSGMLDFWVDCGANDLFGEREGASFEPVGVLHTASVAKCNNSIRDLYYDLEVIFYLIDSTDDEALKAQAQSVFDSAFSIWDTDIQKALEITKEFLAHKCDSDFCITALGHAHIDLAWLWPIRETLRKAERTVATVMRNAEKYDEYLFGISQPQMILWLKERHPKLYDQLKDLYKAGRLELQGGFWVESDTNLPCGESLMRQMLYGKKFFREEFGNEQEILWIPDVFGYSAQLPQIMAHFGVKYFLTIKMSWNSVNLFPHSTFNWVGLDGSTILTHMPPEGNYNSAARPESLISTEKKFRERKIDNRAMMLYGIGDGGGGPGEEHLERLRREYDLRGVPKVKQGFAIDFFKELEAEQDKFPEYSGELYLEKHQGTYTSQANNKKNNRKCEFALHNAELFACAAARIAGLPYPKETLEKLWKEILLYQFHDIIPGSSIKRVYDETDERYACILNEANSIISNSVSAICKGEGKSVFNPLPYAFDGFIKNGDGYCHVKADPLSFGIIAPSELSCAVAKDGCIENELLKVTFSSDGTVESIIRKEDGFSALCGGGNRLTVYEDEENAWEVPADYAKNPFVRLSAESMVFDTVDGVARIRSVYRYGDSTVTQTVSLAPGSSRVDFDTHVDWKETHRMLRAAFPLSVKCDNAKCDIQYGCIDRPTHTRDSFAKAKKEVCAHRYVDFSDGTNGIALINDCKYGHRLWDCVADIDLLRSSMYPGVDADKGEHDFVYSLLIHKGDFSEGVSREAAAVNNPPFFVNGTAVDSIGTAPLFDTDCSHAVIDWVKAAEDGNGIIVRIFESDGIPASSVTVTPSPALGFEKAFVCDGDEKIMHPLEGALDIAPHKIVTLRFL